MRWIYVFVVLGIVVAGLQARHYYRGHRGGGGGYHYGTAGAHGYGGGLGVGRVTSTFAVGHQYNPTIARTVAQQTTVPQRVAAATVSPAVPPVPAAEQPTPVTPAASAANLRASISQADLLAITTGISTGGIPIAGMQQQFASNQNFRVPFQGGGGCRH